MPLSDEEARAWIRDLTTALERRNRENAALRAQLDEALSTATTIEGKSTVLINEAVDEVAELTRQLEIQIKERDEARAALEFLPEENATLRAQLDEANRMLTAFTRCSWGEMGCDIARQARDLLDRLAPRPSNRRKVMNARKLAEELKQRIADYGHTIALSAKHAEKLRLALIAQADLLERIRNILNDDDEDQPTYAIAELLRAYDKLQKGSQT